MATVLSRAAGAASWAGDLLTMLGRSPLASEALVIDGDDPILPTPFRVGEAAAAALGAQAVAAADLWRLRGGGEQRVDVDVRAAAASLLSFLFLRLPGLETARRPPATVALYRAGDGGWVHLHGGFPHLHAATLAALECEDDAAAIAAAVARRPAQEIEDDLARRGLCGARLRSAEEWSRHPQGVALGRVRIYLTALRPS